VFVRVFIDGLSAALPVTVVVDEQDAAGGQSRIQMNQFLASDSYQSVSRRNSKNVSERTEGRVCSTVPTM